MWAMSCFQVLREGLPDRETIIIILIRTCPTLFAKKCIWLAFESQWCWKGHLPQRGQRNEWDSDTPCWNARLRGHQADSRPAGGVLQHATSASSFRLYVAGATRRSSRHQATRRLYWWRRRGPSHHWTCNSAHAAVMLPILVSVSTPIGRIAASPAPLCERWLKCATTGCG